MSPALLSCLWGRLWAFSSLAHIFIVNTRVASRSFTLPSGLPCGSEALQSQVQNTGLSVRLAIGLELGDPAKMENSVWA